MPERKGYLDFIEAGHTSEAGRLEQEIASWESQFSNDDPLLGYRAPKWPLHLAAGAINDLTRDTQNHEIP